jgi:hypothetical protein
MQTLQRAQDAADSMSALRLEFHLGKRTRSEYSSRVVRESSSLRCGGPPGLAFFVALRAVDDDGVLAGLDDFVQRLVELGFVRVAQRAVVGDVWEWCEDGFAEYTVKSASNPCGNAWGSLRVFRGGGWRVDAGYCRAAYRRRFAPLCRSGDVGFRLAGTVSTSFAAR